MADEASNTLGGGIRNYLGTIGFSLPLIGLEEFVRSLVSNQPALPHWASFILIATGLPFYVAPWAWDRLQRFFAREEATKSLEYLSSRDSDLRSSIITAAWRSAYGRWYAAQILVNSGQPIQPRELLRVTADKVLDKIVDGDIEVRGRRPGQMDYETIPRTYWRSTTFYVVDDPIALWRIILCPKGLVEIAQDGSIARASDAASAARTSQLTDYDNLLVDAYQFERLWPTKDRLADKKRRGFLKQARRRKLDSNEIGRLSDPPIWRRIGFWLGFLFVVGLIIGSAITVWFVPIGGLFPKIANRADSPVTPPKKFYSESDKGHLAEAMYAVSTDLTDKADRAVQSASELANLFANENSLNANRYDPSALASKLKEARDFLSEHEAATADINAKYAAYHDELVPIWDWNTEAKSIIRFREALGDVEAHIVAFQLADRTRNTNPDALNVDHAILNSMPQCITIMQERAHDFALWSNAARQRADNFKRSL